MQPLPGTSFNVIKLYIGLLLIHLRIKQYQKLITSNNYLLKLVANYLYHIL